MLVPISPFCAQENLRTSFDESIDFLCAFILSNRNSDRRNKKQGFSKKQIDRNTGQYQYYKLSEWWKSHQKTQHKIEDVRAN
jgi:hypothetical protein